MSVTTRNVPRSMEGLDKCPECSHLSTVMTDYYPADRVDPECSAGYCTCREQGEGCECTYEWG